MNEVQRLAVFCHKMTNALNSGFDIQRALLVTKENESGVLADAIDRTYKRVSNGMNLNVAMRTDEAIYTPQLVDAVYVTEQTGHVEKAFSKMAVVFDTRVTTRRRIMQASIYPIFVFCILICAVLAVAAVGDHLLDAVSVIAIVFAIIFLILFFCYGGKTLSRKNLIIGNVLIRLPKIGKLIMKSELADFADNMALFYDCGVSVYKALQFCSKPVRNRALKEKILRAGDYVSMGNPLSEALSDQKIFPFDLVSSIKVGEKSGDVTKMLEYVADYYRTDIKNSTETMFALLR